MSIGVFLALFGAGVVSFLTPCVLPLVPAYVGMVAGDLSSGESAAPGAALFVCGFASVFVMLGAVAGRVGGSLSELSNVLQRGGGGVIILLGVALLASRDGRGPRERRLVHHVRISGRIARPLALGVAFGAAWTPCVGPLLGAALVTAARAANPVRGAALLFAYAIGVGVPFVAAALTLSSAPGALRRVQRWSHRLLPLSAATLIALGFLLATGTYGRLVDALARVGPAAS